MVNASLTVLTVPHVARFVSSSSVLAMTMSARSTSASRSTSRSVPSPVTASTSWE